MLAAVASAVRPWLPDGAALSERDWQARHRVIAWVLFFHVPAVVGYSLATGHTALHSLVEVAAPAALAMVAARPGRRRVRALAVSLGLITCSAVFVHLSGGLIEWHFHYFVILALVALYQDWHVYLVALGFVVVQHALGSWLSFHAVYNHGNGELWWAIVHGGFVLAASASHITAWRFNEVAQAQAEALRAELHDGETSIVSRLEQTAQMRTDLIATASHEFRTPLTVISGAAATLQRHLGVLSADERDTLLSNIVTRSDRLALMLESMLIVAQIQPADGGSAPLRSVVADVATRFTETDIGELDLPDVHVALAAVPLGQLVERLFDAARLRGDLGADARFAVIERPDAVRLEVRVRANALSAEDVVGLLEPFTGGTYAIPRNADVGLGLVAIRRIAEQHGGSADVQLEDGCFVVQATLPLVARPDTVPEHLAAPGRRLAAPAAVG